MVLKLEDQNVNVLEHSCVLHHGRRLGTSEKGKSCIPHSAAPHPEWMTGLHSKSSYSPT